MNHKANITIISVYLVIPLQMPLSPRTLGSLGDLAPFPQLKSQSGNNPLGQLSTPDLQELIPLSHLFSKFQHTGAGMLTS